MQSSTSSPSISFNPVHLSLGQHNNVVKAPKANILCLPEFDFALKEKLSSMNKQIHWITITVNKTNKSFVFQIAVLATVNLSLTKRNEHGALWNGSYATPCKSNSKNKQNSLCILYSCNKRMKTIPLYYVIFKYSCENTGCAI